MEKLYVSNKNESCRMFQSDFLERFSHVHPATPLVLYLPLLAYLLYHCSGNELGLLGNGVLFLVGVLIWTLLEYTLHRFVFHFEPRSPWQRRLHFIFHGVHHDYPRDATRLVMPPSVTLALGPPFWFLYAGLFGAPYCVPLFAGSLLGYLAYDTMHFALHHFHPRTRLGVYLRQQHMRHHYLEPARNFGVTSPLWDVVFGTLFKSVAVPRRSEAHQQPVLQP